MPRALEPRSEVCPCRAWRVRRCAVHRQSPPVSGFATQHSDLSLRVCRVAGRMLCCVNRGWGSRMGWPVSPFPIQAAHFSGAAPAAAVPMIDSSSSCRLGDNGRAIVGSHAYGRFGRVRGGHPSGAQAVDAIEWEGGKGAQDRAATHPPITPLSPALPPARSTFSLQGRQRSTCNARHRLLGHKPALVPAFATCRNGFPRAGSA